MADHIVRCSEDPGRIRVCMTALVVILLNFTEHSLKHFAYPEHEQIFTALTIVGNRRAVIWPVRRTIVRAQMFCATSRRKQVYVARANLFFHCPQMKRYVTQLSSLHSAVVEGIKRVFKKARGPLELFRQGTLSGKARSIFYLCMHSCMCVCRGVEKAKFYLARGVAPQVDKCTGNNVFVWTDFAYRSKKSNCRNEGVIFRLNGEMHLE